MRSLNALVVTLAGLAFSSLCLASAEPGVKGPTPDEALKLLADGNARYVSGNSEMPHQDQARRCETFSGGQHPFAAILSCADSRAPVELIYDGGVGDLFVVRVAGNVATAAEIGSLEYGVEHLGVPVIVVLGHNKCGAVTAALTPGGDVSPSLGTLLRAITPAVERTREQSSKLKGDALVTAAVRANVQQQIDVIVEKSEVIRKAMGSGSLKVVGGIYDLHSGMVTWLNSPAKPAVAEEKGEKGDKDEKVGKAIGEEKPAKAAEKGESRSH